jgi:type IV pilus assembly protein PilA
MKKWMKRLLQLVKEEKGLTLVELLAVIVILGIIAAIAVPAIGGLIGNTKKEAHKANAHQLVEAARQMVAISGFNSNVTAAWTGYTKLTSAGAIDKNTGQITAQENSGKVMEITLDELKAAGYLRDIKNPEGTNGSNYSGDNTKVYVYKSGNNFDYFVDMDDVSSLSDPLLESQIDNLKIQ